MIDLKLKSHSVAMNQIKVLETYFYISGVYHIFPFDFCGKIDKYTNGVEICQNIKSEMVDMSGEISHLERELTEKELAYDDVIQALLRTEIGKAYNRNSAEYKDVLSHIDAVIIIQSMDQKLKQYAVLDEIPFGVSTPEHKASELNKIHCNLATELDNANHRIAVLMKTYLSGLDEINEEINKVIKKGGGVIRPFLKWVGGKMRVLPELLPLLPKTRCLVEPFVGGASVFLNTDYSNYILADINPDLINLYRNVRDYTEEIIEIAGVMFREDNNPDAYYDNRLVFNTISRSVERSAIFLYLNRHCFNGVCRYNLDGEFNVPYGKYKKPYFPEQEIRQFAEKAKDTKALFLCASFQQSLKVLIDRDMAIYCDPPYFPVKASESFTQYYGGEFKPSHHAELVKILLSVNRDYGVPVVISNSETPETRATYSAFNFKEISVNRSVGAHAITRGAAKEVIGFLDCW